MEDVFEQLKAIASEVVSAKIEELKTKNPWWIPVSERLPEEDRLVLYFGNGCAYVAFFKDGAFLNEAYGAIVGVTHWMPLPAPPQNTEPGGG